MPTPSTGLSPAVAVDRLTALLRWSCALLFFARAWQHLRWDAPFRALLWSQDTMERPVAWLLGLDWQTYATSPVIAEGIANLIRGFGVFYLLCGVAALACTARRRWSHLVLALGSASLVFLAYLCYRDRLYRPGEFGEYALQFSLPLVFCLWIRRDASAAPDGRAGLLAVLRAAFALTFACHGLYAVGFYPTPGEWVTMTIVLTGLDDVAALHFLHLAGLLDFVVALAVLLPAPRLARPALAYAAAWGLATALARGAAFIRWENLPESTAQWLHESVMRLPHATVPLVLFLALRARDARPANAANPASPALLSPEVSAASVLPLP